MCALFGILDHGHILSIRQRSKILSVLARASEVRGTDAAGIAYNSDGKLRIYKRPKAAHKLQFRLPEDVYVMMGHTRLATQGDERLNYNNHPFEGETEDGRFALAHNGILYNDEELRKTYRFAATHIQTDSYIAVQLLERYGQLNFDSIRRMAEELRGTFTITILDDKNNLYIVRGNNPICLCYWKDLNLYIYTSTEEILTSALKRLPFSLGKGVPITIEQGGIEKIDSCGIRSSAQFSTEYLSKPSEYWFFDYDRCYWDEAARPHSYTTDAQYIESLRALAYSFGYSPDDVDELLADGITPAEIEELFYCE